MTGDRPGDRLLDVLVVGGGAAGLAAGLQLARSRRSVLVADAGEPRNAPAAHLHAYLGHDGSAPADLLAIGRSEVRSYGGMVRDGRVVDLRRADDDGAFVATLDDGTALWARRVLLATGLVDVLPDLPGVAEQWGRGVLHCPYCHGWEVQDRRIVVLATGPLSAHQALLFRQLSDRVVVVAHDPTVLGDDDRRRLLARGVAIEERRAVAVESTEGSARGVRLDDGRLVEADAVVVSPRFVARSELVRPLGVEPVEAPRRAGEVIPTDERGATSVAGLFAAGNVSDVSAQLLQAAAEGSRVAAAINADLVLEEADRAVATNGRDVR